MKSPFSKDFWQMDNLRGTWEYKTVSFILRAMVALIVVMYLVLTAPTVWPWLQATHIRSQPADKFAPLLTEAISKNDFEWAHRWLQARPQAEVPQHAATLEAHIGDVPAMFVYTLARASKQADDIPQQRFWITYAQYRMRFDAIRCSMPGLIEKYDEIQNFATSLSGEVDPMADVRRDPARMADMLQKVLDYDARHPATNAPHFTCNMFKRLVSSPPRVVPQEAWATIRHTLRLTTEEGIHDMRARASAAATPVPADEQQTDETP